MIALPQNLQSARRSDSGPDPGESNLLMAAAEMHSEGLFDRLRGMFGGGSEAPKPKEVSGRPDKLAYPTSEEADKAIEAGHAYGTSFEDYVGNKTARVLGMDVPSRAEATIEGGRLTSMKKAGTKFAPATSGSSEYLTSPEAHQENPPRSVAEMDPETQSTIHNIFSRAHLAVGRDPIAALGFDPKNTLIDALLGKEDKSRVAVSGLTQEGRMYTNMYHPETSVVHESIHNGLDKLKNGLYEGDTETPAKYKAILQKYLKTDKLPGDVNEDIARQLMRTVMGADETAGGKATAAVSQIDRAQNRFEKYWDAPERRKMLRELQDLAASAIAKKHPMGPR